MSSSKGSRASASSLPISQRDKASPADRIREAAHEIRIGTLAFSQEDCYEARWFTDRDLLMAIDLVKGQVKGAAQDFAPDLLLLSGARFWSEADKKGVMPQESAAELAMVVPCPVLLEWPGDNGGPNRWLRVEKGRVEVVRNNQYVLGSADAPLLGHLVLAELASGLGVIELGGIRFVLLICGEARVLQHPPRRRQVFPLPFFEGDWVLLHPSHRPYADTTVRAGYGLIGAVDGEPPVLQVLTAPRAAGAGNWPVDPPQAVIHAGPFRQGGGKIDRAVATVAFRRGRAMKPRLGPIEVPGLVALRYAEFAIPRGP